MKTEKAQSNEFNRLLGEKIKSLRTINGMTQIQVASALGYESTGTISLVERGERGMSNEMMFKAAELFGVPVAVLTSSKVYTETELSIIVNLMTIIDSDIPSPHMPSIEAILKTAAREIKKTAK